MINIIIYNKIYNICKKINNKKITFSFQIANLFRSTLKLSILSIILSSKTRCLSS